MFCDFVYVESLEYRQFWKDLGLGELKFGEFKWFVKDGFEVWIEVLYNLVFDDKGNVIKIVKFVIDIIEKKLCVVDVQGQLDVIFCF